jgi:hypothetical protein
MGEGFMSDEQVVVGDVEAGRSARIKREVLKLIKGVSASSFDLADLLYEIKSKNFFSEWGFTSYSQYLKSLSEQGMKYSKAYYLYRVTENGVSAGLKREEYEPVGLTKLRLITRLKPAGEYNGVPMPLVIRELTLKALTMTPEEVQFEVDTILGQTEDDAMVWMNFKVKKLGRENVIKPALALIKKHCPESQLVDEETGAVTEMSDGAALEMMAANILADPNFNTEDESQTEESLSIAETADGTPALDEMFAENETEG